MANRAYLFSNNYPGYQYDTDWEDCVINRTPYYDSRWYIPFSWFFFFLPSAIKLVDTSYGESTWKEVKFITQKDSAIRTFAERRPLLYSVAGSQYDCETIIGRLVETLADRRGKYLRLDPGSVLGGISEPDDQNISHSVRILEEIAKQNATAESIKSAISYYSMFDYKDGHDFEMQCTGVTYSFIDWLVPWSRDNPPISDKEMRIGFEHCISPKQVAARRRSDDFVLIHRRMNKGLAVAPGIDSEISDGAAQVTHYAGLDEWIERCMIPDHLQFCKNDPDWAGVFHAFLRAGAFVKAEEIAALHAIGIQRVYALAKIGTAQYWDNNPNEASRLWNFAFEEAKKTGFGSSSEDCSSLLKEIAEQVAKSDDLATARNIAEFIHDTGQKLWAHKRVEEVARKFRMRERAITDHEST